MTDFLSQLIQAGRRLYKTPGQHLTLGQVVELNKRFIEGYLHFEHEPRIQALKAEVLKYNRTLRDLGLKDHQVELCCNLRVHLQSSWYAPLGSPSNSSNLEDAWSAHISRWPAGRLDCFRFPRCSLERSYLHPRQAPLSQKAGR